ncbi:MAG TPA: GAF domain-containing protein, partial [Thermoanaerobaculia bacterium]
MAVQTPSSSLERELDYRRKLTTITNQINSADSIQHILVALKDKILELLDAERLTIYAVDTKNQELYSIQKAGDVPKEIRVPKSFASIAGFAALSRRTINIADAYDAAELQRLHPNLKFDQRWDKQSGFRTKNVLASPILFEKYLLGVIQLINKRHGGAFTPQDVEASEEIARILGIAFYNQHKVTRSSKPSKFGQLIDKGVISEKDLEAAASNARINNVDISKVLVEDHGVPKDELGRSLAAFYSTQFFENDGMRKIPDDLRQRITSDIWKKYVCAPVERRAGVLIMVVEDPHDLTKLDAIRAMSLSARYDFWVGLKPDIMAYIANSYGESLEPTDAQAGDVSKILTELGEGEAEFEEE